MPIVVFNIFLQIIIGIILVIISIWFSIRFIDDNSLKPGKKQKTKKWVYFLPLVILILMIGGAYLFTNVQATNDKNYCENHEIEFSIIEHGEIKDTRFYANVRRVQTALDSYRKRYQLDTSGISLKELHLYKDHESFIKQTENDPNVAAFFSVSSGAPSIHLPSELYLMQPESILHEVMHSFMYEILGDSYIEIPLWFHDGYAQYLSINWIDIIEERYRIKTSIWEEKPKELQIHSFLLNRQRYPSNSELKGLFYDSSFSFIDYLESKSKSDLFKEVMFNIPKRYTLDSVIRGQLGVGLESLYSDWLKQSTGLDTDN